MYSDTSSDPLPPPSAVEMATAVQHKYEADLLSLPHVVGVGIGYTMRGGASTGQVGLIVMVDEKLTPERLPVEALVPRELDGVPVDVQAMGAFWAQ